MCHTKNDINRRNFMVKKKQFVALLLAICMIIPAMLMLTACGKPVDYTISSAEQYANAMSLKDSSGKYYENFDALFMNGDTKAFEYKLTKNAAYKYSTGSDSANLETIWTNENGKGVIYTKQTATSEWVRTEQEEEFTDADLASKVLPISSFASYLTSVPFESIKDTYNEESKMYSGSYNQSSSVSVDVKFQFEDGKLVKIDYESKNRDTGAQIFQGTRTITYGNAKIEIPKVSA